MIPPLVSVVTGTWQRHDLLLNRCAASVQLQDYPAKYLQHCIVSDGPDPELALLLVDFVQGQAGRGKHILYRELGEHHPEPNFGHYARRAALELATGAYITYNDDDDSLRPEHCRLLAQALDETPHAGFAVSRMMSYNSQSGSGMVIGWGPLACGNVGTPMIMHRREILQYGTWGPPSRLEDWELVEKWLKAGVPYVNVDAETADVWPSIFR